MRLYTIYKLCKSNIDNLKQCDINSDYLNGEFVTTVKGWLITKKSVEQLYTIKAFQDITLKIYEWVPIFYRDADQWKISGSSSGFAVDMQKLIQQVDAVIGVYESFGFEESKLGIDIRMPNGDFKDFVVNIKSLEYIFNQCPLLKVNDGEIRFNNVDVGSTWLTFLLIGTGATIIAQNLAALVDKAIALKSHLILLKQQEEALRKEQFQNDILEATKVTFNLLRETTINQYLDDLQSEEISFTDAEERDKTKLALEKLADLIDKGMEIYASIDSPDEIQVLFPTLETKGLLTDNIMKLLSTNEEK